MSVDYDLVIIGSSPAGVYAAVKAAEWKARVALVEENPRSPNVHWFTSALKYSKMLNQLGQTVEQLRRAGQFGIHYHSSVVPLTELSDSAATAFNDCQPTVNLAEAIEWGTSAIANYEEMYSPAVLASLGIDWIEGSGQFVPKPHLAFEVKNRRLRSRAYLLATGTQPALPEIEGLQATGYFTPETLDHFAKNKRSPDSSTTNRLPTLTIIGGELNAIEIAQTFARLGTQVTLVVPGSHILAQEDPQAAFLIQAHLEAEGVRVLTQTQVTQARQIDGKKWIQAGDLAIESDEIVFVAEEIPKIATLNLDRIGVKWDAKGLVLNNKLQTTNPAIYACGMGNHCNLPHLAHYEANIALKNALFWPRLTVDYQQIPRAIFSDPPLARVGLMEDQARQRYGQDVVMLCKYFKTVAAAHLKGETTGFCKMIVRRNGEILGACIVGSQADELIHILALAIQQRLKVSAIASISYIFPTFAEILSQTAAQWHQQRFDRNTRLQDFLENLFNLRRHWFT